MILFVLGIVTFFYKWYLATALIGVVIGALLAFLRFNINPAKVFMGDSGALALGGLLATLILLLNIKMGIIVPFLILFLLFEIEILTSFLQIIFKKIFKRKLFPIAPFHHMLEYKGRKEPTIVMKFWLLQGVLSGITLILIFYQFV
jgi:phospho-N-acetylmuramoyl-pentapeptide-transferase